MTRHQTAYSDETKAVVMAALLTGQSVNSVAREYNIPKGTVSSWKEQAHRVEVNSTQKRDLIPIGDKLLVLLATEIDSLIEISKTTRDPDWIKKQDASQLAVFTGVKHDKLIRMLEAFNDSDSIPED